MKDFKIQTPNTSTDTRPRLFWRISFLIVLFHSLLMCVFASASILAHAPDYRTDVQELMSSYDTAFLLGTMTTLLSPPLQAVSSLMATLAFAMKRQGRRAHKLLVTHVSLQLGVGLLFAMPIVYQNLSGFRQGYSLGRYQYNEIIEVFTSYAILSVPLLLLASRGIWILIVKPPPQTDASGKFLNCASCGYDLQGTPGSVCPECGESVTIEE